MNIAHWEMQDIETEFTWTQKGFGRKQNKNRWELVHQIPIETSNNEATWNTDKKIMGINDMRRQGTDIGKGQEFSDTSRSTSDMYTSAN